MKITGYRTLSTRHAWGRAVGDSNGWIANAVTEVPILLIDTDEGVTGIGLGQHADIARAVSYTHLKVVQAGMTKGQTIESLLPAWQAQVANEAKALGYTVTTP